MECNPKIRLSLTYVQPSVLDMSLHQGHPVKNSKWYHLRRTNELKGTPTAGLRPVDNRLLASAYACVISCCGVVVEMLHLFSMSCPRPVGSSSSTNDLSPATIRSNSYVENWKKRFRARNEISVPFVHLLVATFQPKISTKSSKAKARIESASAGMVSFRCCDALA